jgi:hypothetical protein
MQNLTVGHVVLMALAFLFIFLFIPGLFGFIIFFLLGYGFMDVAIRGLGCVIDFFINQWNDN